MRRTGPSAAGPSSSLASPRPSNSSHAGLTSTTMPSCTCAIASVEPVMNARIWSRYCRAEASVPFSALSSRAAFSSRVATACSRPRAASVRTSARRARGRARGRLARSELPVRSAPERATRCAHAVPSRWRALRRRIGRRTAAAASWAPTAHRRGLSSSRTHVQCTAWPALRRVLLMISTGSCCRDRTMTGMALVSPNFLPRLAHLRACGPRAWTFRWKGMIAPALPPLT